MKKIELNIKIIKKFEKYLYGEERSRATVDKYIRDIMHFYEYMPMDNKEVTKEILVSYKEVLFDEYKISSVNSMLVALNRLFEFIKRNDMKLKLYKVQHTAFYEEDRVLTRVEYKRLLKSAKSNSNKRLYILLQTICATGIRVSEHKYITVEALENGKAVVKNKGKVRVIFIPKKLRRVLKEYCKQKNIISGSIFLTRNGKTLDRSNIWKMMKNLCKEAKVNKSKVFPHNLRHLFAFTFYGLEKDIVRLADVLGHSSIDTTRIYTKTSIGNCLSILDQLETFLTGNTPQIC